MKRLLIIISILFFAVTANAETFLQVDFLLSGLRDPSNDQPLSNGKVYTYLDGTSTLSNLKTDKDGTGSAPNPIILSPDGTAEVFGSEIYKFEVFDSDDNPINTFNGLKYKASIAQTKSLKSDYGCDLPTALAALGTVDPVQLIADCDCIIADGTSETITDNISTDIIKGGSFDGVPGGGVETLSINGQLEAGAYQVFLDNLALSGTPLIDKMYAEWTGGVSDGATDSGAAINKLLAPWGDKVYLQLLGGTYIIESKVIIRNGNVVRGIGHNDTFLKLKNSTNTSVVETLNFASLTGQNKWKTSDGVVHGFELIGFTVDGNRANNTSGAGIAIYGKRYIIDDIRIKDTAGFGFYSEAGNTGGQDNFTDQPITDIGSVWVHSAGSTGFIFRGPHDGFIKGPIDIALSEANGFQVQSSATYLGDCEIGMVHAYASTDHSIVIQESAVRADLLVGESASKHGVFFIDSSASQISKIQAYANGSEDATYSDVYIDADSEANQIGSIRTGTSVDINRSITVLGPRNIISSVYAAGVGVGSTATGLYIDGAGNRVSSGLITNYNGAGGIGLHTNDVNGNSEIYTAMSVRNCETLWQHDNIGAQGNEFHMDLYALSGQAVFTGSIGDMEILTVTGFDTDTVVAQSSELLRTEILTGAANAKNLGLSELSGAGGSFTANLTDGDYVGQEKEFRMINAANPVVVKVLTHSTGVDINFTFGDVGDYMLFRWTGTLWVTVNNFGAV